MAQTTPSQHDQSGQTMAEYGVVLALVILGVIGAFGFFGAAFVQLLTDAGTAIGSVVN